MIYRINFSVVFYFKVLYFLYKYIVLLGVGIFIWKYENIFLIKFYLIFMLVNCFDRDFLIFEKGISDILFYSVKCMYVGMI